MVKSEGKAFVFTFKIRERKKRTLVKRNNILFIPNISNYGSNLSKRRK
jgi:hypothetical protein